MPMDPAQIRELADDLLDGVERDLDRELARHFDRVMQAACSLARLADPDVDVLHVTFDTDEYLDPDIVDITPDVPAHVMAAFAQAERSAAVTLGNVGWPTTIAVNVDRGRWQLAEGDDQ